MTKILWADDQQDVIRTLSGLLSPLAPSVTPVKSGTEALRKLKTKHFDVLILDLMMPPGKWGGLWLLEEIGKARIRIPVIVLSGEGTQTETIRALRLGARDYVTKDKVQAELLQLVSAVLEQFTREMESQVTTSFPTPLALAFRRYVNTTTPTSQLRRLIEFYESSLRLSCIIGICELSSSSTEKIIPPKLASAVIQGPSMGTWNEMRHTLAKRLPKHSPFFQLHNSFDNTAVSSIVQLRNDISHGAEPSRRVATELVDKWGVKLRLLASRLWQNLSLHVFLPLGLRFDGIQFLIEGRELVGDNVTLPAFAVNTSEPKICGHPYVLAGENGEDQWVDLFPLILIEAAVEPNAWQVLVFDGVKCDRTGLALTGQEPIRYVDIWSGQRNVIPASKPASSSLPGFLIQASAS